MSQHPANPAVDNTELNPTPGTAAVNDLSAQDLPETPESHAASEAAGSRTADQLPSTAGTQPANDQAPDAQAEQSKASLAADAFAAVSGGSGNGGMGNTNNNPPGQRPAIMARLGAEQKFPIADRVPVQLFFEETWIKKLGDLGPTLTAFLSLFLAGVLGYNAYLFNRQQLNLIEQQTTLQTEQVKAQLADMRFKFLNDLTNKEENKKIPAEIGLAGHGLDALPVVYFALGVEQPEIRDSAVSVVNRMFQAANYSVRSKIMESLLREFDSPNKLLHVGLVASLVKIQPLLDAPEQTLIVKELNEHFPPQKVCTDKEGRMLASQIATFFPVKDPVSIPQLLQIARYPRCGDGWLQAMLRLEDAARVAPKSNREALAPEVEKTEREALNNSRVSVSDEDFESGGFQTLGLGEQESSRLKFKDRVGAEFQALKKLWSQ